MHTSPNNQEYKQDICKLALQTYKTLLMLFQKIQWKFASKLKAVIKWDSLLQFQVQKWIIAIMSIIMVFLMMLNDIHYELIQAHFRFGDDLGFLEPRWWFCDSAWDKKGFGNTDLRYFDTHRSAWSHRSRKQSTEAAFQRTAQQCISVNLIIMHFQPKKNN